MGELNSEKSIFQQLIQNTKLGKLLYGDNTYTDGYGTTRTNASLGESAAGQELQRMGDTAVTGAKIAAIPLSFTNPYTASSTASALLATGAQSYFMTEGLKDAYNRYTSGDDSLGNSAMITLDVLGAIPAVQAGVNGYKQIKRSSGSLFTNLSDEVAQTANKWGKEIKQIYNKGRLNLGPTSHLQGDDAVKMFKKYGGMDPVVENSPLMEQITKYIPEARERYGLIGNTAITDDEIARALYKQAMSRKAGANVNEFGEPILLFRGDTQRYDVLQSRLSPEELAGKSGTMDNSLGTLFLGELPTAAKDKAGANGISRYVSGQWYNPITNEWQWRNSGTGVARAQDDMEAGYQLFYGTNKPVENGGKYRGFIKDRSTTQHPNDINAFLVKTDDVRDATNEISVLNDDALTQGYWKSTPHMSTKLIEDADGFPLYLHPDGTTTPALYRYENRKGMAEHYRYVLDDAKAKGQGLIKSNAGAPLRDEHGLYDYYALPNFNLDNAKHLLKYDLNRPTYPILDTGLIYRKQGGILKRK